MNAKLTLKLNETVIEKAKEYARKNQRSLSELVENYFRALIEESSEEFGYGPLTKELSGIICQEDIENFQAKYENYLSEKYQ